MSYDAKAYWTERAEKEGPTYVAGGGDEDRHIDQLIHVGPIVQDFAEGELLDFGCGPQRFRPWVEAGGATYHGVDIIPGYGTQPLIDLVLYGFDTAMALWVFQHIVDEDEYVHWSQELYRSLEPGGKLLVVDHNITDTDAEHMHPRGWSRFADTDFWKVEKGLGQYRNHWIGVFTK